MTTTIAENSSQIVLLASGESEKLHPLIESKALSLLPIANRPVMEIVIEKLARDGFKNILVCLSRLAGSIETYFGDGRRWGVSLQYILIREDWGTAGALHWARSLISGTFMVMPADILLDLDIQSALRTHYTNRNFATSIVYKINAGKMQQFQLDDDSHIVGINPDNEDIYFETGIYVFEPQVLDWIPQRKKFGIHAELLPALTDAGKKIGACILSGYWNPLESYCDYHAAQSVYLNSVWREKPYGLGSYRSGKLSLTTKNIAPGVWTGRHTSIHPGARLSPPVLLGDNVRVGQGVELGPEVVIGDNVFIGDEATIQYTTIFDHTYVGKLVHLDNRVVDKNLVVDIDTSDYVFITDKFLLSETPYAIKETLFHRAFDAIIASFFLLLVIPLTFIIGFLLFILYGDVFQPVPRIKSGPTQQRSGQAPVHSVFYLLRFQTRQKDGGFTRIGKWLERVEWHRLPELWNVLVGDMRLVGVKPVAPEEVGLLTEVWQKTHLDYYPGFTGLWDIQNDSFIQPDDALIADIYYVATRTWKEDLNILLKTPQAWIKRIAA